MHPRYTCHAPRARIPCKKYHAGHMRAPPCARTTSLTDFLNFCARGLPHRPWHRHRDHLLHRQMDISIVNVVLFRRRYCRAVALLSIAAVGAIFIIAADVVDVILSSRTCEYRRHDLLHHQRTQTMPSSVAPPSLASCVLPDKLRVGGWDVCASSGDDDFKFFKVYCTA